MQIKLHEARLIEGIHCARNKVVDVEESLARYLVGNGLASKAPKVEPPKDEKKDFKK
jgi:hypothetical protein